MEILTANIHEKSDTVLKAVKEDFEKVLAPPCLEMTLDYEIKNTEPGILINNTVLINPGEFFVPIASPGVGKTTLTECAAASLIAYRYGLSNVDTFGLRVNGRGKALIADTERTPDNCSKTYKNIFKRLGKPQHILTEDGKKLKDLTHLVMSELESPAKLRSTLEAYLNEDSYSLVILDGGLDFCEGMNDEERAIFTARWIRANAVKHNCCFIVTVHPNKGTSTPAGHFGAFLIKWARAVLLLRTTQDKSIKEITTDFEHFKLSHANAGDFEPVYFSWNDQLGMMTTCEGPKEPTYKASILKQTVIELRLKGMHEMPSAELRKVYSEKAGISEDRAKKHISLAAEDGLLIVSGKGKNTSYLPAPDWTLTDSGQLSSPIYRGEDNPNHIHERK